MKKIITITIMAICLISLSLAYYPGETIILENDMGIENLVYTIIGNSSQVSTINVTINSTNITISFPQDMIPDNFDIVFLEEQTKEVVKTVHSRGKSRTKYVDKNVTVYVPEYINTTEIEEVEVEKIVEIEVVKEKKYNPWYILLAIILMAIILYLFRENMKLSKK